jgi:hypothetical protein
MASIILRWVASGDEGIMGTYTRKFNHSSAGSGSGITDLGEIGLTFLE